MALDRPTTDLLLQLSATGAPPIEALAPDQAREMGAGLAALFAPGDPSVDRTDRTFTTADGTSLPAIVLTPQGAPSALVVHLHGGGWVFGAPPEFEPLGRELAARTGSVVVLPTYRLAPEHRHPTAVEDAWSALLWASEHMEELCGARVPLVVAGDSAGGNLAAVLAQRAAAHGEVRLDLQLLDCPVCDADLDTASYLDPDNQVVLTRAAMAWFWDHYAPEDRLAPEASPLRASDLRGLPPAIVVIAEHDVLRDECEAYARRLREAGVMVHARTFAGQMHGFPIFVGVLPGSADAVDWIAQRMSAVLGSATGAPR